MSFSVPTSPATSRSTKAQPVTPQRLPRQHQSRSQSYRSPLTPSSPYTPLSLRSVDSTDSSILTTPENIGVNVKKRLVYPGSLDVTRSASAVNDKSLADIADNWRSRATENGIKVSFTKNDESHYRADDSSDISMSAGNDSSLVSPEEALLAAPFLSTHRRLTSLPATRPRAQSHASLQAPRVQPSSPVLSRPINRAAPILSPQQSRRSHSVYSQNLMSTPPPNRALARQLKLKGSFTDPAQPRRREAFGALPTPQNSAKRNASMSLTLEPDTSLDLFDINEDDFEYENEQQQVEDSFSHQYQHARTLGYPEFQHDEQPIFSTHPHIADPFYPMSSMNGLSNGHVLTSIAESVEQHFHANRQPNPQNAYYEDLVPPRGFYPPRSIHPHCNQLAPQPYPAFVPIPSPSMHFQTPISQPRPLPANRSFVLPTVVPASPENSLLAPQDCSVCLAPNQTRLAILKPCGHPLCSACLTSALNIVGEKDMGCAVCKQKVADFKLIVMPSKADDPKSTQSPTGPEENECVSHASVGKAHEVQNLSGKSFMDPLFSSSPNSSIGLDHSITRENDEGLESVFEFGLDFGELRASTPKLERQSQDSFSVGRSRGLLSVKRDIQKGEDNVVLRIDNVPWDITPLQITKWLQQPVERVHVLLDGKGKTLSHAYVEIKNASIAGAILRGEASPKNGFGKKERGSVLGRGRRARGVTITRSGQQELMNDLFPQWRGSFDGSRPSLSGVEGDRIIAALEGGLLTEGEIGGLLHLIREPDSHFLKVPVLPFHSLISILSKFPADVDSRVFWSAGIRDSLFETAHTALETLLSRVEKGSQASTTSGHRDEEHTHELVLDLLNIALGCKAFTSQQAGKLIDFANAHSLPLADPDVSRMSSLSDLSRSGSSAPRTPASQQDEHSLSFFGEPIRRLPRIEDTTDSSIDDLAKEFGVDAHLVQALAQRLAKLG